MKFETGVVLASLVVLGLAFIALLGHAVVGQPDDLEQQRALYCEMVETFKNTGGEYGWPDYKGAYRRDCQ